MLIRGSCHCGNIAFTLDWQPEPTEIPTRACTCGFCTRHGGVWTACPTGMLEINVGNPSRVSRYAFETKTAQFHVCADCGVVPVATSMIDECMYAVVNVNTFENVDAGMLRKAAATFDGESEGARLARRKRNWIGNVVINDVSSGKRGS